MEVSFISAIDEKYQIGTESGSILWDIAAMKGSVKKGNYKMIKKSVFELIKKNPFNGNPEYAMSTDISEPCIVVGLCPGKDKLIDGNHRLYKANILGCKTIDCYYLSESEHINFILNYDHHLYKKIVAEF